MATACICARPLLAQQLEERSNVLPPSTQSQPENTLAVGLDDNRRIAMALVDGEFVHRDDANAIQIDGAQLALQVAFVDAFDRRPGESVEGRDMAHRHDFAEPGCALLEPNG
jgi:hypothetical protein